MVIDPAPIIILPHVLCRSVMDPVIASSSRHQQNKENGSEQDEFYVAGSHKITRIIRILSAWYLFHPILSVSIWLWLTLFSTGCMQNYFNRILIWKSQPDRDGNLVTRDRFQLFNRTLIWNSQPDRDGNFVNRDRFQLINRTLIWNSQSDRDLELSTGPCSRNFNRIPI